MKVLDTSVVAKWYIHEDDSEEALQIEYGFAAGDFDIVVPDIILYELANCIRFSSGGDERGVIETLDNFANLEIAWLSQISPSLRTPPGYLSSIM